MLKVEVIDALEMDDTTVSAWSEIQSSEGIFASPFFHPCFTVAVGMVRADSYVGIIRDGGKLVGFFPFHSNECGEGRAIAYGTSDYQGVIVRRHAEWAIEDVLQLCGLKSWRYDHLVDQPQIERYNCSQADSPVVDLSDGFSAYEDDRIRARCRWISKVEKTQRKIKSTYGDLRFILHDTDARAFWQILDWKRDQYIKSGQPEGFCAAWETGLLDAIYSMGHAPSNFRGVLSTLYVGDTLVAGHFGMISNSVWHWWYPSYNPKFSRFSPGLMLILEIAKAASQVGVDRIDLGKGEEPYKKRLQNGCFRVSAGVAKPSSFP